MHQNRPQRDDIMRDWKSGILERLAALALALAVLTATLVTAGAAKADTDEIRIAQQFGVSYLPLIVVREQGLLEKAAAANGIADLKVEWQKFSGAAAMNEALISGNLDVASAGIGPLITVWSRTHDNLKVHAFAALGSIPNYLNTNNPNVESLKDFTASDKIALPSVKVGFQPIVLQMAAEQAFGEGNHEKLDDLTVSLPHPDALAALTAGNGTITAHFTSPPFQQIELKDPKIHRVLSSYDVLGGPHTFNVVYGTAAFHDENPKLSQAFVTALQQAVDFINKDPKAAAALYAKAEKSPLSVDEIEALIRDKDNVFTLTPQRTEKFAEFLYRTKQIDHQVSSWKDLFFPEIQNLPGS
jgi:NitT/TauT family transport system substrate-binding protein